MEKELLILEEGPNEEIDIDALLKTFKNARLENLKPGWCTQMFDFKNSSPSTADWLPKRINACRKLKYPNG